MVATYVAGRSNIQVDWRSARDGIDLRSVLHRYLGPPEGRTGSRGDWWRCPFHADANPSFTLRKDGRSWNCWGCGKSGDAIAFVRKQRGLSFKDAVAELTGGSVALQAARRPVPHKPKSKPSGPSEADVLGLIEASSERLWKPEGSRALAYLIDERLLTHETVRAARLGWGRFDARGFPRPVEGVLIAWFDRKRPTLVKVRRLDGGKPKYVELWRNEDRPPVVFPNPEDIRIDRPLVVVEGEFDALLVAQVLEGLASVATLGSASGAFANVPDRVHLAPSILVATDADAAGDRAAEPWMRIARAIRVRPPAPFKDWTDAARGQSPGRGVNLARWWSDVLAGNLAPPLFTYDELSTWRWGPGLDDPTPGIVIEGGRFDPEAKHVPS